MSTLTYTSSVTRPDGLVISLSVTAPADRPDVGELAELAQMGASQANNLVERNAAALANIRARREEVAF